MHKEPSNNDEPLTKEQKKYLRIGCVFVWLASLAPIAMLIAVFAVCSPGGILSGSGRGLLLLVLAFALLLIIATAVVFAPDEKKKPPSQK